MEHPIRVYRQTKGLTLDAFARIVGVQKAAVSKWERGIGPSPMSAMAIEEKTGGSVRKEQLRPDFWPSASEAPQ